MTCQQAIDLIAWIPKDKILQCDIFKLNKIENWVKEGHKPSHEDAQLLVHVYRYTQGAETQDQEFKPYQRKKSWGI